MSACRRRSDLEARLREHRAVDADERAFVARTLALIDGTADPFDRSAYDPGHVTSSGYVLSPTEDAVLLVRHATLGRWLQPGGHIEPDDRDVLAAARREIAEETGLVELASRGRPDQLFDVDIHPIPERVGQPAHEHFDVRFLFRARVRDVRRGTEVGEVAWVPIDRFLAISPGRSVRRVVLKIRAYVSGTATRLIDAPD